MVGLWQLPQYVFTTSVSALVAMPRAPIARDAGALASRPIACVEYVDAVRRNNDGARDDADSATFGCDARDVRTVDCDEADTDATNVASVASANALQYAS